jgi:purine-binding chemotaxis protein CheW
VALSACRGWKRSRTPLDDSGREPNPVNLDPRLARVFAGIHRLDGQLLMMIDVDRVLDVGGKAIAA